MKSYDAPNKRIVFAESNRIDESPVYVDVEGWETENAPLLPNIVGITTTVRTVSNGRIVSETTVTAETWDDLS